MPVAAHDLTGRTFGRLTVLDRAPNRGQFVRWNCLCTCGITKPVDASELRKGSTKSCGCLQQEVAKQTQTTHGHSGSNRTREYRSWEAAKQRCFNPNTSGYKNYGGRGITMCEAWALDFNVFLQDMGPRPEGHSLDRVDSNGNYEPSNCRWADVQTQNSNRRK
jgi:hypothetical protein